MKRVKKILKYLGIIIIILILFRGFLYRTFINYSKIDSRVEITLTDQELISEIDNQLSGKTLEISEIVDLSRKISRQRLAFTFENVSSNPNGLSTLRNANYVGYSSLFNSIGNYILKKQNMTETYKFNHLVGKLDCLGMDIHDFINHPFFKDHDFNEIVDLRTGKKTFVDPSLNDYLRITTVSCKE